MDMKCILCYEHAVLPVRITAFSCACNYDIPICCMRCVERFLELDKHPSLRTVKKCLFCPATRDTKTLMIVHHPVCVRTSPFFPQKILWRVDTGVYPCPRGCGFQGSQEALGDHIDGVECPKLVQICDCTASVPREEWSHHIAGCRFWNRCTIADCPHPFFRVGNLGVHMTSIHKMSACKLCKTAWAPTPQVHLQHRRTECTYQEACKICREMVRAKDADAHYREHLYQLDRVRNGFTRSLDGLDMMATTPGMALELGIKRQRTWVSKELKLIKMRMIHCRLYLNT